MSLSAQLCLEMGQWSEAGQKKSLTLFDKDEGEMKGENGVENESGKE